MSRHPNLAALEALLAQVRHTDVATFLRHMMAIHPPGRLPARTAFDPLAVPALLPGLVLVHVEYRPDGAPRLFIKVAGERIRDAAPMAMMNRYVDELLLGGERRVIADTRQTVIDTGTAYYWYGAPRMKFKLDFANLEYVHCPLAEDGETIDHILSFFHYEGTA